MRKAMILGIAVLVAGVLTTVALAGNGGSFKTFGDGDAIVQGNKAAFVIQSGQSAGVYKNAPSKSISKVRFHMVSYGDVQGGAPRFSIALDTDGNPKTTESYAFLDAANCGGVVGDNPTFTPTTIDTASSSCKVFINTGGEYDNWAALVTAHPGWQTSKDPSFVIADVPGDYHVKDISLYS